MTIPTDANDLHVEVMAFADKCIDISKAYDDIHIGFLGASIIAWNIGICTDSINEILNFMIAYQEDHKVELDLYRNNFKEDMLYNMLSQPGVASLKEALDIANRSQIMFEKYKYIHFATLNALIIGWETAVITFSIPELASFNKMFMAKHRDEFNILKGMSDPLPIAQ